MLEIRWHGRGGQGTKTASLLLADVAFTTGLYVQGFPEYGPERMGAPITAFNRLSNYPIYLHSNIYEPDIVVVVDDSLIDSVDVTSGLKNDGTIIINSQRQTQEIITKLSSYSKRIFKIDGKSISKKHLNKNLPNTSLLAATVRISGIMSKEDFTNNMKVIFEHKFKTKPEVIEGNLSAIFEAWEEVNLL